MDVFKTFFLCIAVALLGSACGAAKANSITVETVWANDGTKCYVMKQGETAFGGNCVP
jgi:hypothetical protein